MTARASAGRPAGGLAPARLERREEPCPPMGAGTGALPPEPRARGR